jgi:hypothetical protein
MNQGTDDNEIEGWQHLHSPEYLGRCAWRIENIYLTWVEQFLDILEEFDLANKRINDIGCNLLQFYKGMHKRKSPLQYYGYDVEKQYLDLAKDFFPKVKDRLQKVNIIKEKLQMADFSVVSAMLEHLPSLSPGLDNILRSTREVIVLRTFLGEKAITQKAFADGASEKYWVNQYSFEEILNLFDQHGFESVVLRDRFTDSMPKLVLRDLVRTQFVIRGIKIKKEDG